VHQLDVYDFIRRKKGGMKVVSVTSRLWRKRITALSCRGRAL